LISTSFNLLLPTGWRFHVRRGESHDGSPVSDEPALQA
jgi:hypothetical protein